jgi:hypothetical protein
MYDAFLKGRRCPFSVFLMKNGIECYQAIIKLLEPVFQQGDHFL